MKIKSKMSSDLRYTDIMDEDHTYLWLFRNANDIIVEVSLDRFVSMLLADSSEQT